MELTDRQIQQIRDSYRLLVANAEEVSAAFYRDLFNRAPEARPLFRDDLSEQGMRFMSAIHLIVDHLDDPARLEVEVDKLVRGHAALPIKPAWYRQMQEALIDTFAVALGARFTNEMELAWRSVFGQICDRMEAGAAAD